MASVPQSSWFCTLRPTTNATLSPTKPKPRIISFNPPKSSSSSSSNSPENPSEAEPTKADPLKLAFARAKAYKEAVKSNPVSTIVQNPVSESAETGNENDGSVSEVGDSGGIEDVPLSVKLAIEKAKEYKKTKEIIVGSSGIAEKNEVFSGTEKAGLVSEVTTVDNHEVPASVKLALEKAQEYKKNKGVIGSGNSVEEPQMISGLKGGDELNSQNELFEKMVAKKDNQAISSMDFMGLDFTEKKKGRGLPAGLIPVADPFPEGNFPEVEILVGDPSKFEKARVSEPQSTKEDKVDVYKPKVSSWGDFPRPSNISKTSGGVPAGLVPVADPFAEGDFPEVEILVGDPSKFGKARVSEPQSTEEDKTDVYKPKVSSWGDFSRSSNISKATRGVPAGLVPVADPFPEGDFPEVEILVGDTSKFGKATVSEPPSPKEDKLDVGEMDVYKPKVSSWGLFPRPSNISKTTRGVPAGLVPVADPFPEGDFPEVEILVGDTSKFGKATVSEPQSPKEDKLDVGEMDVYKPKVSSWGVFPRPSNISKAYGGGRVIRPGDVLETAEAKAAKDARTRERIAAYRRKRDSSIDPKLKSECEEDLKDGDSLMDLGKLKEALPFYERVMDKITFQSELHGLAALQWAICQDSLTRRNEARIMYEKLQSHPIVKVSKTAKHFLFSFEAMEMLKVKSTTVAPINLGYDSYFEAFIENKTYYRLKDAEVEEGALNQALPYLIFLASPIFIVLLIAFQKRI